MTAEQTGNSVNTHWIITQTSPKTFSQGQHLLHKLSAFTRSTVAGTAESLKNWFENFPLPFLISRVLMTTNYEVMTAN